MVLMARVNGKPSFGGKISYLNETKTSQTNLRHSVTICNMSFLLDFKSGGGGVKAKINSCFKNY